MYLIRSISFETSFLDISLLGYASPAGKKAQLTTNDLLLQDVARIYFEQIKATIQRDMPPSKTQSQISTLDEDTSLYSYGPQIQGGELQLTIAQTVATLIPLNLSIPLVTITSFHMGGLLFMAGLSPETPGIGKGRISHDLLLCHQCVSYGITSHSSGIPIKIYTNCKIICDRLDLNYGLIMNESIPLLMECIQRLLPPPPELEAIKTAPLTWWDNLRFFIHGNISIHADKLSVKWLLDSQYLLDYAVWLTCNSFTIEYYLEFFGIVGSDLQVSVPGSSYDMTVHPSRRKAPKSYLLPHEVMVGEVREDSLHPVVFLPSISVKTSITWKMLSNEVSAKSTDHHCSYVKSDSSSHVDKFANFRSDGLSTVKYKIDLPGADQVGNWLLLRIDVLPWFTHVNSTIMHLKQSSDDDLRAESLPQFRNVDISVQINELKLATWFSDGQDLSEWDDDIDEGVCITIQSLTYTSSNGDKNLIIEGPVKAALLDVSEFNNECMGHRTSDDDDEMSRTERACENFGGRVTIYSDNDKDEIEMSTSDCRPIKSLFVKLQEILSNINELDYVANAGQIDIQNKSLQSILAGRAGRASLGSDEFAGVYKTTWSILVSQLKILWTLDIRDSVISLTQDLLFTFGFMQSQLRQSQLLAEKQATIEKPIETDGVNQVSTSNESMQEGIEVALSLPTTSRLDYLLKRSSSYYLDTDKISSDDNGITSQSDDQTEGMHENPSLPTIDVHFSNPQVQLHRKSTGASIILAMEGAHVEGTKFVRFLVDSRQVKGEVIGPSDLTRRTGKVTQFYFVHEILSIKQTLMFFFSACIYLDKYAGIFTQYSRRCDSWTPMVRSLQTNERQRVHPFCNSMPTE